MVVRGFRIFERWLNLVSSAILIIMMLMVTSDVTSRYLFNRPILGTLECIEFSMVGMIFLGFAYTQGVKAHIKIDLVTARMSPKAKEICHIAVYLLGLLFFALIVWHGSRMAIDSWKMKEISWGASRLPVYPAKTMVPFGSLIICLQFIVDIGESILNLKRGK